MDLRNAEEEVLKVLEGLDVICVVQHQEDVLHISLIGAPGDIESLNAYLLSHKRKHQRSGEDSSHG